MHPGREMTAGHRPLGNKLAHDLAQTRDLQEGGDKPYYCCVLPLPPPSTLTPIPVFF